MTLKLAAVGFVGGAVLALPALAQCSGSRAPAISSSAATSTALTGFARKAAVGGMLEVELGRLATEKSSNDRVKEFGQRMVNDHSKANSELKLSAGAQGVELPARIDAKQKASIDRLSKLSGAAFDKAYIRDMVADHEKDVAEFEKAAAHPGDSPIKNFAGKTLPTLRQHLKMAREVDRELSGKTAKTSS
jgi:putative membrane protein